jgi:hypothetical protein
MFDDLENQEMLIGLVVAGIIVLAAAYYYFIFSKSQCSAEHQQECEGGTCSMNSPQ